MPNYTNQLRLRIKVPERLTIGVLSIIPVAAIYVLLIRGGVATP
jgi:hypothetical protein